MSGLHVTAPTKEAHWVIRTSAGDDYEHGEHIPHFTSQAEADAVIAEGAAAYGVGFGHGHGLVAVQLDQPCRTVECPGCGEEYCDLAPPTPAQVLRAAAQRIARVGRLAGTVEYQLRLIGGHEWLLELADATDIGHRAGLSFAPPLPKEPEPLTAPDQNGTEAKA